VLAALILLLAADPTIDQAVRAAADPCRPQDDAIVVCKHNPGADRDRLPPSDTGWEPGGAARSVSGERHDLIDGGYGAGDLTAGSCSAVGASGATGCTIRKWRQNDQQKGW
jgi:hypothetical protein